MLSSDVQRIITELYDTAGRGHRSVPVLMREAADALKSLAAQQRDEFMAGYQTGYGDAPSGQYQSVARWEERLAYLARAAEAKET